MTTNQTITHSQLRELRAIIERALSQTGSVQERSTVTTDYVCSALKAALEKCLIEIEASDPR